MAARGRLLMVSTVRSVAEVDIAPPPAVAAAPASIADDLAANAGRDSRRAVLLWLLVTLAGSLAFGAYLSANRLTDPFLYYDTAFVQQLHTQTAMTFPA